MTAVNDYPRLYPCLLQPYMVPDQVSRRTSTRLFKNLRLMMSTRPFRYSGTEGLPVAAVKYVNQRYADDDALPEFYEIMSCDPDTVQDVVSSWGMKWFSYPCTCSGIGYLVNKDSITWAHGLQIKLDMGFKILPAGSEYQEEGIENLPAEYVPLEGTIIDVQLPVVFKISPEMEAECINNKVPLRTYAQFNGMPMYHLTPVRNVKDIPKPFHLVKLITHPSLAGFAEGLYRGENGRFYYAYNFGHDYEEPAPVGARKIKTRPEACGSYDTQNYALSPYGGCMLSYHLRYDPADHAPNPGCDYSESTIVVEIAKVLHRRLKLSDIRSIGEVPAVAMLNEDILKDIKLKLISSDIHPGLGPTSVYYHDQAISTPNLLIAPYHKLLNDTSTQETSYGDLNWGNLGSGSGMGITQASHGGSLGPAGYSSAIKNSFIEDSATLWIKVISSGNAGANTANLQKLWSFVRQHGFSQILVHSSDKAKLLADIAASGVDFQVFTSQFSRPVVTGDKPVKFGLDIRHQSQTPLALVTNRELFNALVDAKIEVEKFSGCMNPKRIIEKILVITILEAAYNNTVSAWFG